MSPEDTIREGRMAAAAVPWMEMELNRRFLAAARRVCQPLPPEDRDALLADMRACLNLAATAGAAILDGVQAIQVERE